LVSSLLLFYLRCPVVEGGNGTGGSASQMGSGVLFFDISDASQRCESISQIAIPMPRAINGPLSWRRAWANRQVSRCGVRARARATTQVSNVFPKLCCLSFSYISCCLSLSWPSLQGGHGIPREGLLHASSEAATLREAWKKDELKEGPIKEFPNTPEY
jgi:hypothetical protein